MTCLRNGYQKMINCKPKRKQPDSMHVYVQKGAECYGLCGQGWLRRWIQSWATVMRVVRAYQIQEAALMTAVTQITTLGTALNLARMLAAHTMSQSRCLSWNFITLSLLYNSLNNKTIQFYSDVVSISCRQLNANIITFVYRVQEFIHEAQATLSNPLQPATLGKSTDAVSNFEWQVIQLRSVFDHNKVFTQILCPMDVQGRSWHQMSTCAICCSGEYPSLCGPFKRIPSVLRAPSMVYRTHTLILCEIIEKHVIQCRLEMKKRP